MILTYINLSEYSDVKFLMSNILQKEISVYFKKSFINRMMKCCAFFLLSYPPVCRYTEANIVATPLNNAQPWRLFLSLHSERLHG